jgi:hypothetical protein
MRKLGEANATKRFGQILLETLFCLNHDLQDFGIVLIERQPIMIILESDESWFRQSAPHS